MAKPARDVAKAPEQPQASAPRRTGPTKAVLHPVDGNSASGTIYFKKKPGGLPMIAIRLQGLDPVYGQERYVLWQWGSRHNMLGISSFAAREGGRVVKNVDSASEPFFFLEDGSKTWILIARIDNYSRYVDSLSGEHPWDPDEPGKPILRGPITGSRVGVKEAE